MDIYLYKGRVDVAATTLADLNLLIAALLDESDADNQATIARVTGKIETLVQADTGEPLNIYSYDDGAGTVSSWVTNAAVTLAIGLGDPDPANAYAYASTSSTTISGSSRLATLALNTSNLANALGSKITGRRASANLYLHIRKTESGITKTVGLIPVMVAAGVISQVASAGVVSTAYTATSLVAIPAITSLTGGGASALDGLATAGGSMAVGSTVLLSYGRVGQTWQLIAGTDATNAAAGVVRPADYNVSTNAVIWVQL